MSAFDLAENRKREREEVNTQDPRELPLNVPRGHRGAFPLILCIPSTVKDTPNRPISGAFTKSGTSESLGPKSELPLHEAETSKNGRCDLMTRELLKSFPCFRVRES